MSDETSVKPVYEITAVPDDQAASVILLLETIVGNMIHRAHRRDGKGPLTIAERDMWGYTAADFDALHAVLFELQRKAGLLDGDPFANASNALVMEVDEVFLWAHRAVRRLMDGNGRLLNFARSSDLDSENEEDDETDSDFITPAALLLAPSVFRALLPRIEQVAAADMSRKS